MNRKRKFLVGSALIVAAMGALIYTAVRETSAYFLTVEEYASDPATHEGQALRLAGRVSSGSVKWDPRTLDLEFLIQPIPKGEGGSHEVRRAAEQIAPAAANALLPVRYNGILPDMFADGRDVIVEGRVQDGVFHARALLTTCPSKYEADKVQAGADPGVAAKPSGELAQAR